MAREYVTGFQAITAAPILSPGGRPVPVELRLVEDASSSAAKLLYREGAKSEDPGRGMSLQEQPWVALLNEINSAYFRYYIQPVETDSLLLGASTQPFRWGSEADQIPMRIELNFQDRDGETHSWRFNSQSVSNATPISLVFTDG